MPGRPVRFGGFRDADKENHGPAISQPHDDDSDEEDGHILYRDDDESLEEEGNRYYPFNCLNYNIYTNLRNILIRFFVFDNISDRLAAKLARKDSLALKLSQRPQRQELIERNILHMV